MATKGLGKDFSLTLAANGMVAAVSALSVLLIPRALGPEQYGYWQLFIFYGSYSLLLQMGIGDGSYLRYGGKKLDQLSSLRLGGQALTVLILVVFLALVLALIGPVFIDDSRRLLVWQLTCGFAVFLNMRHLLVLNLQAVGEFKTASLLITSDRFLYIFIVLGLFVAGNVTFENLILADVCAVFVSMALGLYLCRDPLRPHVQTEGVSVRSEVWWNMYSGLQLSVANVSSMLITGIPRLVVDVVWGVKAFGAASLSLSLSRFVMVFVNSAGLVLFPGLRRAAQESRRDFYMNLRRPLAMFSLVVLLTYHPLVSLLSRWMPDFAVALTLAGVLFPIIVFEVRMGLLINPLMKAERMESTILAINVLSVIACAVGSLILVYAMDSVASLLFLIVGILAIRALTAEFLLFRRWRAVGGRFWIVETLSVLAFIALNGTLSPSWSFVAYFTVMVVVIAIFGRSARADWRRARKSMAINESV